MTEHVIDSFGDYISSRIDYDLLKDIQQSFEDKSIISKATGGRIIIESTQMAHDETLKKILGQIKISVEPKITKETTISELKNMIDTNLIKNKPSYTATRIMLCFDGMVFLTDPNDKKKISDYLVPNGCIVLLEIKESE
jgi:transcriptional regulator CtsR